MAGNAVVVGGGIAGLAAAVGLRRRGWQVTLLERRPELSEIGAGLTLWPNALRALDALGVGPAIRGLGLVESSFGVRNSTGRWLSRTDSAVMAKRFGDGIVVLERPQLLAALRDACTGVDIRVNAEVDTVTDGTVTTSEGGHFTGDVVIGADGLWSTVRRKLWPDSTIRPTGVLAARLIGTVGHPISDGGETWGRGDYAGVVPLPDGRIYAYLVVPVEQSEPDLPWWQRRFADWHFPLPQLLADPEQLLLNELFDLAPLPTLVHGNLALVGDAGHAITPNLGQGACQALEDAVELAACLNPNDATPRLNRYDERRRPRVHLLAKRSRAAGVAAAWRGRLPVLARNTLVSVLPDSMLLRNFDAAVNWRPPTA
ncbi:MAG TPA: FAD-dependent oxidoreductase [Pseudonocardiaceae bacterium]|jgi:2-polyprenyl-6-methoxyphenol hydroxylase-like FAD-dependent oxidoreductase